MGHGVNNVKGRRVNQCSPDRCCMRVMCVELRLAAQA